MLYAIQVTDQLMARAVNDSEAKHDNEKICITHATSIWHTKSPSFKGMTNAIFREKALEDPSSRDVSHFADVEEEKLLFLQHCTYNWNKAFTGRQLVPPYGRF